MYPLLVAAAAHEGLLTLKSERTLVLVELAGGEGGCEVISNIEMLGGYQLQMIACHCLLSLIFKTYGVSSLAIGLLTVLGLVVGTTLICFG